MSEFEQAVQLWTRVLGGLETAHSAALGIPGVVGEDVAARIEGLQKTVGACACSAMEHLSDVGGESS